ncbi:ABC-F family ATP-binding cassette domain-containing protein [Candidatus Babeliales bacterium]|nr:ABC-F family ATP-binding cassette domain-containing protein [Candidatus Babeliales bacterium]
MINGKDLNLFFRQQTVFDDISFNINLDQKIGLVGRNGSGKTTLLKVLAGQQNLDSGTLSIQKDCTLAYMPQEVVLLSDKNILQEAFSVFGELLEFKEESDKLEQDLTCPLDIERYAFLQEKLSEFDYAAKLIQTKKILLGLGFLEQDFENKVCELSVGWKMRLVLGKLLLQDADFYLFDEPTNHLDIVAKDWFLDFLKNARFGFILVSHDRYFLNNLCEYIYELSLGKLNVYRGNYTKYLELKEQNKLLQEKKFVEQQKYIKKQEEVISRFKAKASKAKMAQSMMKSLDKIERIEIEHEQKTVNFSFHDIKRAGKVVLKVKNLSKIFGDKVIFKNVNFEIERGQKVAVVAPNGMGKTTLFNTVIGKLKPDSGSIELGYNVDLAIFEQDQNRSLNLENTILQEVENSCTTSQTRAKVRSFLGGFLFSGDSVDKKIKVLSGGEKNRVAMVKVLLQNANFLILDEPTNHLDLQSKEILLKALRQYSGTILFVSHDRDFLNELADHIFELTHDGICSYVGNYDAFLYQKAEQEKSDINFFDDKNIENKKQIKNINVGQDLDKKLEKKQDYKTRKKMANLESKIARLEKEKSLVYVKLGHAIYGTQEYDNLNSRVQDVEQDLEDCYKLWEELEI